MSGVLAHGVPVLMADDDALEIAARRAARIRAVLGGVGSVLAGR